MKIHRVYRLTILFSLTCLFLCACGGHQDKRPARLQNVPIVTTPTIDGITYEPYTEIDICTDEDGNSIWDGYFERGELFGYHYSCLYSYFYEIEGLDRKSWFLHQMDDNNGAQNEANVEIWKAKDVTEIPDWIEEARKRWLGDKYPGLPEGCTTVETTPIE